ncbi:PhoPQ-activated pathogenicity-related family protein [Echinicola shivajiensis]|uniref:PhoPQ-activated pathogenicity-related family protein n=1 Tax=Echinicola shivajiensis TaxID=1035916 RepID=UPI001BFC584D|nr:PhoPQ-activated protein PqaA family protein [Echinicola shivajiensis]
MIRTRITILISFFLLPWCFSLEAQSTKYALKNYLNQESPEYSFKLQEKVQLKGLTQYEFQLTSQKWKDYIWEHRLVILVPKEVKYNQALLYIGGGKLENGLPANRNIDNEVIKSFEKLAVENKAIVALIFQVPNQPIFDGRTEDEIISYTLHQYQETGDETWPLLFPMVKSVQRGMDAIITFSSQDLGLNINNFMLTGLSKRGWTTWLTASQDNRVNAIAPMVIDVLNMPVSLQYQIEMWNAYSPEIQDYVDLGIPQQANTPAGKATIEMVDPYSYRDDLTIPKLVFIGTNDPYWPIDAAKNYWDHLPGENNLVYIPNVEHDLGDRKAALANLSAFFELQCKGLKMPNVNLAILKTSQEALKIKLSASELKPKSISVWESYSEEDMDFRDELWNEKVLEGNTAKISLPKKGQKSVYFAFHFITPEGKSFYISSRIIRCDRNGVIK